MSLKEVGDNHNLELEQRNAFIDVLVTCATERNPRNIMDFLRDEVHDNPNVDWDIVENAYAFQERAHEGQVRERDVPPPGKPQKPYTTHTAGAAWLTAHILGEEVTTTHIVSALLHDTQEDGKLYKGTLRERDVTNDDIRLRFGEDVAWTVGVLSRVKDVRTADGKTKREPITDEDYDVQIIHAEEARPNAGIYVIKFGADVNNNMIDPMIQLHKPVDLTKLPATGEATPVYEQKNTTKKKDAWSSRTRKIQYARERVVSLLEKYPVLQMYVLATANVAEQTTLPGFDPQNIRKRMPRRMAA